MLLLPLAATPHANPVSTAMAHCLWTPESPQSITRLPTDAAGDVHCAISIAGLCGSPDSKGQPRGSGEMAHWIVGDIAEIARIPALNDAERNLLGSAFGFLTASRLSVST